MPPGKLMAVLLMDPLQGLALSVAMPMQFHLLLSSTVAET